MIGSVLYWVTAAVTLAGYEFLQAIGSLASGRPPVALYAVAAARGCALLVAAGFVNLWRPKFGGIVGLIGTLLIWSTLLSPMQLAVFFYALARMGLVYAVAVLIVATLAGLSTIYACTSILGRGRFWAAPASAQTDRQSPTGVRVAIGLLYCWLAILASYLIQTQWRLTGVALWSIWIVDLTILAALLWVIIETSNGRNWARITLLILLVLILRGLITDVVKRSDPRPILALGIIEFAIFCSAIVLLFSGASALYFKKSVLPK